MLSRYGIFCEVVEQGSFTLVAQQFGYSQSSVSQSVKTLEADLGTTLLDRRRGSIALTEDGQNYYPYLKGIYAAELSLESKKKEMNGLNSAQIRLGTFTSVSRELLPRLMQEFKLEYPNVRFELKQGDYTSIMEAIRSGEIDLGFTAYSLAGELEAKKLYREHMMVVLPIDHPLAAQTTVSLYQLEKEPFILMDEGEYSLVLEAFAQHGLSPRIEYKVYDDYTIISMVRQNLGVSIQASNTLRGFSEGVAIRPVTEDLTRTLSIASRSWNTVSKAAGTFAKYVERRTRDLLAEGYILGDSTV